LRLEPLVGQEILIIRGVGAVDLALPVAGGVIGVGEIAIRSGGRDQPVEGIVAEALRGTGQAFIVCLLS
jgi:hypothetical protein